ncbi:hypothetical protein ACER0A_010385 [Haloimpatiens sp. FM7315]|uniref:hypothetical protein n=1 Tax=Haloimpatiens sp. FM7315 TaxID=3298609 RepID=UPI0035A38C32
MKIGSIIKGTGRILGTVTEFNIKITGEVIGTLLELSNKPKVAEKSRDFGDKLGDFLSDATRFTAEFTGNVVDKTIDKSVKNIKKIQNKVIKESVIEINEKGEVLEKSYIRGAEYKVIE